MKTEKMTYKNTVGDFVNVNPENAIDIFNDLDIDFCCGGFKTLEQAYIEKELIPEQVLEKLGAESKDGLEKIQWSQMGMKELIEHILETHHVYLKSALPRLETLMDKVYEVHHKNHPELSELKKTVKELILDLGPHMLKEKRILFPMIQEMEDSLETKSMYCSAVKNPIRVMMSDHDNVGDLFEQIKTLTDNYTLPENVCDSYKLLGS